MIPAREIRDYRYRRGGHLAQQGVQVLEDVALKTPRVVGLSCSERLGNGLQEEVTPRKVDKQKRAHLVHQSRRVCSDLALQRSGMLSGEVVAWLGACPMISSWRRKPPRNNLLTAIWTLLRSN